MSVIVQISVTASAEYLKSVGQLTIRQTELQEGGNLGKYAAYWDGELVAFIYHDRKTHISSLIAEAMSMVTLREAEKKLERIAAHPSPAPE